MSKWTATIIGVVGIALWATETSLVSFTGGIPTFEIVGLAFGAAALLSPAAWWVTGDHPGLAFRQPWSVWAITVPSLVCYHACIYFAVHRVPAAPAALLQGCTPLFIVFGSALLPGQRLRWWHIAGVVAGLEGLVALSMEGRGIAAFSANAPMFLGLIGIAAGLWGFYSLVSSRFATVPTSAMGVFYAASALIALACHYLFEQWVMPTPNQWAAITALGVLPMGLALFCWDYGLKKGDVQALGAASYVEPLIGAGLVAVLGQGDLRWSMLISGVVIIGGAFIGSASFLEDESPIYSAAEDDSQEGDERAHRVGDVTRELALHTGHQHQAEHERSNENLAVGMSYLERLTPDLLLDTHDRAHSSNSVNKLATRAEKASSHSAADLANALRALSRAINDVIAEIEIEDETTSTAIKLPPLRAVNQ